MAQINLGGADAGILEHAGHGQLAVEGRAVVYRRDSMKWSWSCTTAAEARRQLAVFRAAPKYATKLLASRPLPLLGTNAQVSA